MDDESASSDLIAPQMTMDKGLDASFATFINTTDMGDGNKIEDLEVIFYNESSLTMLGVDRHTIRQKDFI